ncbi:MAG TPA: aspartate kinase [Luteibaculaceae bacterium]|nr:aspartate kinase [Luteibaculaceae bacterium]
MIVMKFGGTSVGSAARMREVARLVGAEKRPKVVVLSAMSGTTNRLVEICNYLSKNNVNAAAECIAALEEQYRQVCAELLHSPQWLEAGLALVKEHFAYISQFTEDLFTLHEEKAILAEGELLSTHLFHLYLQENNIPSTLIPALQFMRIDSDGEPELSYISEHIKPFLAGQEERLIVTQGFICRNSFGEIDNLKRGGSDYTASLIGAAIMAEEIQIWTDIDGMHNNDPRVVDQTRPIEELSFEEAAELAYFGAKILHPSSVLPAKLKGIPVKLLNTMQPEAKGTTISNRTQAGNIKAVAAKDGITAIKIRSGRMLLAYGFLRAVFEVFERYKTSIDLITTSEVAISVTIDDKKYLAEIQSDLAQFGVVEVDEDQCIVCVVGDFIADNKGIASRVFQALESIPIRMISYGGSKNNISMLVHANDKIKALQLLNKHVFQL